MILNIHGSSGSGSSTLVNTSKINTYYSSSSLKGYASGRCLVPLRNHPLEQNYGLIIYSGRNKSLSTGLYISSNFDYIIKSEYRHLDNRDGGSAYELYAKKVKVYGAIIYITANMYRPTSPVSNQAHKIRINGDSASYPFFEVRIDQNGIGSNKIEYEIDYDNTNKYDYISIYNIRIEASNSSDTAVLQIKCNYDMYKSGTDLNYGYNGDEGYMIVFQNYLGMLDVEFL